jgi:hypothetical protein
MLVDSGVQYWYVVSSFQSLGKMVLQKKKNEEGGGMMSCINRDPDEQATWRTLNVCYVFGNFDRA